MGWFSKHKKEENKLELPDLPEEHNLDFPKKEDLTNIPEIQSNSLTPQTNPETTNLPSLPQETPIHQEIKTEIEGPEFQKSTFPELKKYQLPKHPDIPDITDSLETKKPRTLEVPSFSGEEDTIIAKSTKNEEPVFIRLDKFQTTIKTFEEIKEKIINIEDLLKKTKEIKEKEEKELSEWENELHLIKSRIDSIDKNIFNKIE